MRIEVRNSQKILGWIHLPDAFKLRGQHVTFPIVRHRWDSMRGFYDLLNLKIENNYFLAESIPIKKLRKIQGFEENK